MSPREPSCLSLPALYILQMCTATCGFPVDSGDRPLLFILAWLVFPSSHPRFTAAKAQMVSARAHLRLVPQAWTDILITPRLSSLSNGCCDWKNAHTHTAAHTPNALLTESVVNESCYCYGCGITKESTTMMTENPNGTAHQNSNTANKNSLPMTLSCVS